MVSVYNTRLFLTTDSNNLKMAMDKVSSIGKVKKVHSPCSLSLTKREIAYYWMQRRMVEEDHLSAALKAAACVKARNLTDDDILIFETSLVDDTESKDNGNRTNVSGNDNEYREIRVGISDWWTKSRYAYLNQPEPKLIRVLRKGRSLTYLPEFFECKCA